MMEERISGNQCTSLLKIIALICMFCDHLGKMVFPGVQELRIIGRLAFPLYAWCLVVGVCHTRNMAKYLLRMLITGLISQPLYVLALNHKWTEPNIFLTLVVALLGLWGLKEKKYFSHYWAPLFTLILANLTGCNYGWKGVLFIYMLYLCRNSTQALVGCMIPFCLYWGTSSATVNSLFGQPLNLNLIPDSVSLLIAPWMRLQALSILSLPLIAWCGCKCRITIPKWLGYALYPMHLALLLLIETIVK
ncbi:MAG: TraX family protein [Clostridia bacterium]|nr:TraX family protein [Clostridia bacterium]